MTRARLVRNLPRGYFADAQDNTLTPAGIDAATERAPLVEADWVKRLVGNGVAGEAGKAGGAGLAGSSGSALTVSEFEQLHAARALKL